MSEEVGPTNLETNPDSPQPKGTQSQDTNDAIDRDIFCQTCGYNLRGLTSNRCPECGSSFEHIRGGDPEIPWMYRRRLGWFRAYWKTVFFVMFKQARFADEMARPVSFKESQSFRWVTVFMAFVPVTILAIGGGVAAKVVDPSIASGWGIPTTLGLSVAGMVGLFLVFAGSTGVPSYFYHPKEVSILQQNRAIALSYYACGPMALLGIPAAILVTGIVIGFDNTIGGISILLGLTLPLGLLAAWWLDLIHLSRRLLPQRPGRAVGIAILVPMLWCFVTGLSLFAIPALVISAIVISRSLA